MLIYNDIEQGTEEWLRLRLGVPTTSNFGKIITPTGKKSSSASGYINKLLAELMTGKQEYFKKTYPMQRGNDLEPEAVRYYEHYTGRQCREVGFVTTRDGRIGCSPDRLVGKDGLLEVKCPLDTKHVDNLRSGKIDSQYIPQVQGQMLLTDRKWCDWISYHPDMPASIVRVERDEEYIAKIVEYLDEFLGEMDEVLEMWEGRGYTPVIQVKKRAKGTEDA
jgi:putative phage-type endonuclease